MTDKEYGEFMIKYANIPYKDYSWLKDHCYRTLERPCSPNARNEHLAILDLIKEHEERQWFPPSEGLPEDEQEVLITYKINDKNNVWSAIWDELHCRFYDKKYRSYISVDSVIAWMPLPEPYDPQESEE